MYLETIGNRIIVDDLENLPADKAEIGKLVISFEEFNKDNEHKTFVGVISDRKGNLVSMEGATSVVEREMEYKYDEEDERDEGTEICKRADCVSKLTQKDFLILPNNKLYKMDDIAYYARGNKDIIDTIQEIIDGDKSMLTLLLSKRNKIIEGNNAREYLPFQLSKDSWLVFVLTNVINCDMKSWVKAQSVYLISSEHPPKRLSVSFNELYETINNITNDFSLLKDVKDDFDKTIDMMKQDVLGSIIEECSLTLIWKISSYFNYSITKENLEKIFEPIYENKELNLKAYLSDYDTTTAIPVLVKNDKDICKSYRNNDFDYQREYRKASALLDYFTDGYNGLNPLDGNIYKNGKLDEKATKSIIEYRDLGGIIKSSHYGRECAFYMSLDGIYVICKNNDEKNEILARRDTMGAMSDE